MTRRVSHVPDAARAKTNERLVPVWIDLSPQVAVMSDRPARFDGLSRSETKASQRFFIISTVTSVEPVGAEAVGKVAIRRRNVASEVGKVWRVNRKICIERQHVEIELRKHIQW